MKTLVKTSALFLSLGVGAIAALPGTALAGDMYNGAPGRLKDYGQAAVPVPAVSGYQEVYQYYFRGDIGVRLGGLSEHSESGLRFGADDLKAPFGSEGMAKTTNGNVMIPGTVGVGIYLSPRFRADFTADFRQQSGGDTSGNFTYTADKDAGTASGGPATGFTPNGLPIGSKVTGSMIDRVMTRSTVLMANAYYDLTERGRFTPYIGAGIGASNNRVERELTIGDSMVTFPGGSPALLLGKSITNDAQARWTLAAAAMAGVTYNFDKRTAFDLNYRLQYIQGYDVLTTGVFAPGSIQSQESRAKIGDLFEHQLRAGVRMNLW
jgi:opacity protein-like surface antigen